MSQDALFVKLELPKKPFNINDLAGGPGPLQVLDSTRIYQKTNRYLIGCVCFPNTFAIRQFQ